MTTLTDSLNAAGSNAVPSGRAALAAAQELAGRAGLTELDAPMALDCRFADGLFYRADDGNGNAQVVPAFDLMATVARSSKALNPNWSFRSGDPVGVLRESPVNAIRYQSPPNTAPGRLIEAAAATRLNRNPLAENATPGTLGGSGALAQHWQLVASGGLTITVLGERTIDGWPGLLIRLDGNQTGDVAAGFEASGQMAAVSGAAYTSSFTASLEAGNVPAGVSVQSVLYEQTAAGAAVTSGTKTLEVFDPVLRRFKHTRTFSGGGTVARGLNGFYLARNGVDRTWSNVEIFLAFPQFEAGSDASSPVPAEPGALSTATRAAETITEGVTVTRASRAWASSWDYTHGGVAGALEEFLPNTPRIGSWGLKREPASTNFIRNPGGYDGTVGTLGVDGVMPANWSAIYSGGNVDVVSIGENQGWREVVLRVYGTFTGDNWIQFEGNTQIDGVNGDPRCGVIGLRRVKGAIPGGYTKWLIAERTAAGSFVKFHTEEPALQLDAVHRRFKTSETLDGGGTVAKALPILYFSNLGGGYVDFQIAILEPQFEKRLTPTSPMRPEAGVTTTNATRAAEVITMTVAGTGYVNQASTVALEYLMGAASGLDYALSIGNASNNDYLSVYSAASTVQIFAAEDGAIIENKTAGDHAGLGSVTRVAFTAGVNDFAASVAGDEAVTDATWAEPVDPPTRIQLGGSPFGGTDIHGNIVSLRIAAPRLQDSNIEALAA